jgi:LPXTG-site transpeptidase (sortase) family protein
MRRYLIPLLSPALIVGSLTFSVFGMGTPVSSAEKIPEQVQVTPVPIPTPTQQPQTPTVTAAVAKPTTKPAAIKGNTLSFPSIGFQGSIVTVGTTADNAIDVPSGKQIGYWNGSARPGTPGAVFLDGHVDGIFAKLSKLSVGQTVRMTYEGQSFNYRVVHTEVVELATIDMDRALSVFGDNIEGLNMMTCAGTYIPSRATYDKRFVVYTVRIP